MKTSSRLSGPQQQQQQQQQQQLHGGGGGRGGPFGPHHHGIGPLGQISIKQEGDPMGQTQLQPSGGGGTSGTGNGGGTGGNNNNNNGLSNTPSPFVDSSTGGCFPSTPLSSELFMQQEMQEMRELQNGTGANPHGTEINRAKINTHFIRQFEYLFYVKLL